MLNIRKGTVVPCEGRDSKVRSFQEGFMRIEVEERRFTVDEYQAYILCRGDFGIESGIRSENQTAAVRFVRNAGGLDRRSKA